MIPEEREICLVCYRPKCTEEEYWKIHAALGVLLWTAPGLFQKFCWALNRARTCGLTGERCAETRGFAAQAVVLGTIALVRWTLEVTGEVCSLCELRVCRCDDPTWEGNL